MEQNNRRKFSNILIDRDLQIRIMANSIIYMICVSLVIIAIILYPLINDMIFSQDLETQYTAAQHFLVIAQKVIPALLAIFLLFISHQLIITHRICGPIINFTNIFSGIAKGDLSRKVRLRKHDYLKDEGDRINEMITSLVGVIEKIAADNNKLKEDMESITVNINDHAVKEKVMNSLEIIKADAQCVSRSLSYFRIPEKNQI